MLEGNRNIVIRERRHAGVLARSSKNMIRQHETLPRRCSIRCQTTEAFFAGLPSVFRAAGFQQQKQAVPYLPVLADVIQFAPHEARRHAHACAQGQDLSHISARML